MTKAQRLALIESLARRAYQSVNGHSHYAYSKSIAETCEDCAWLKQYRSLFGDPTQARGRGERLSRST